MKRHNIYLRSAFSLVELIFVIAVLGIVASIGSEIIVNTYKSYVAERAIYRASIKTELAALQIANRLSYAIPGTVIARKNASTFTALEEVPGTDYPILQWVGEDIDGFSYSRTTNFKPAWSGFCDVMQSSKNVIVSYGSRVKKLGNILTNVGASGISDAALFFAGSNTYTVNNIGYSGTTSILGANRVRSVLGISKPRFRLQSIPSTIDRNISELYKLAWSSYAIVPINERTDDDGTKEYDLELRYGFQPWLGESYDSSNAKRNILIRDVSVFKFQSVGNTVRFKICQRERLSKDHYATICKEKAVIR